MRLKNLMDFVDLSMAANFSSMNARHGWKLDHESFICDNLFRAEFGKYLPILGYTGTF